ncbi:MAG: DUF4465 domain-containing protein, partial [Paludibacteraceae bacterium]|nr:DUF4465 domain-containing protein [Paludibacteraceae bacterium]
GYNPPANDTTKLYAVAVGQDANGHEISRTTFALYNCKDSLLTDWQKWDLSVLGEVNAVAFNIVGTLDLYGQWGLNAPAYFAYDDVAVRFPKDDTALPNSPIASSPKSQKVLCDGQLLILRDGKTYNMMGAEIQ